MYMSTSTYACTYLSILSVHLTALVHTLLTVNPQNYTGVNFRESAQYFDYTSKIFVVWWHKSNSVMLLL